MGIWDIYEVQFVNRLKRGAGPTATTLMLRFTRSKTRRHQTSRIQVDAQVYLLAITNCSGMMSNYEKIWLTWAWHQLKQDERSKEEKNIKPNQDIGNYQAVFGNIPTVLLVDLHGISTRKFAIRKHWAALRFCRRYPQQIEYFDIDQGWQLVCQKNAGSSRGYHHIYTLHTRAPTF